MKRLQKGVIVAASAFTLFYLGARDHLHHNVSGSLPVVWEWASPPDSVSRGDLVEACPPYAIGRLALERKYMDAGSCSGGTTPLLKIVAAVGGDHIHIDACGVSVNGRLLPNSIAYAKDPHGRPLPTQPYGDQVIPAGDVWLYGTAPLSLGSQYYGAVSADTIRAHSKALIAAKLPDLR
jgi:conjugative transfer signal peptidase TraF